MRILLFADYWTGLQVAKYLKERKENIVGLGIHPPRMEKDINREYTKKIIEAVDLPRDYIFDGDDIQAGGETLEKIRALKPELILSIFWGLILKPELIKIPTKGCINLHLSYLPYNRGRNPNIWPIIDGTPAGVTLHYIDEGVDTGDIIAQSRVPVEPVDTAGTLYDKLIHESANLFKKTFPKIKEGAVSRKKQENSIARFHHTKDIHKLDVIDLDKKYTGCELINLLRARTFPSHPSAYFIDGEGRKVYVRVQLGYVGASEK